MSIQAANSDDTKHLVTTSPKKTLFWKKVFNAMRAASVLGVLAAATTVNVSVSLAIHALTRDRKLAQGRCVFNICRFYSWALRALWWVKIRTRFHPDFTLPAEQFVLSSNHVSFLDIFIICHTMYVTMPRNAIENVRLM